MMYVPEKTTTNRSEKIKKELMKFISSKLIGGEFFSGLVHLPMITITKVELTPNLRQAFVYFRNFDKNKPEDILKFLTKISGTLSQQWAKISTSKYTPSIEFRMDEESEEDKRINEIFEKIRHKEKDA